MKIHFERSGGFTGIRLATTVDSQEISPEEAQMLRADLEKASFFDLPAHIQGQAKGADRFHYRVRVQEGEREHEVEIDEGAAPENLQPLLQNLSNLARRSRRP
jgi:hypothetical protein